MVTVGSFVGVAVALIVGVASGVTVSVAVLVGIAACVSAIAVEMLACDGAQAARTHANKTTPQSFIPLPLSAMRPSRLPIHLQQAVNTKPID